MKFEIGKTYHGFKLVEEKEVSEINSKARVFLHEKTGAELFNIENDDDNKVFSISFKTPPSNSTGLPHILEHCVLCGSRKFPVKEPFVELAKGSLNTFLNAMTFSDKTMYPVASKNDRDFVNLMDVYMDAVFYPDIYKYPEIFMQEGWHYELENSDGDLTYNGVVYNEMKGAFSSPEDILFSKIQQSLFPDTTYGVESGGDPDVIPQLTLDEFLDFHRKYYHPSNSYIYLYGKMDLIEKLKFIDEEYLNNFDKLDLKVEIPLQEAFSQMKEIDEVYPISEEDDLKDKTLLSMNFVVDRSTNLEVYLAFDILEHILLQTPASPLKKALIDAGLGKDVFGRYDNSMLQPVFSVVVKNSNENEKDRFRKVFFDTLKKLVDNGIDKKLIEASININEFKLREANFGSYPKGLIYGIKCMDSWLYGENPTLHLQFETVLSQIKTALTTDYFEKMIDKYILNNTHCTMVVLKPLKGLAEKKDEEVKKNLLEYKNQLSDEEINTIIEQTIKLRDRQQSEDSPENLEKIPLLSINDIEQKTEELPIIEKEESGIKVLTHPLFTNEIEYINFYFDTCSVEQKNIPYIGLLSSILGKIGTEKYSFEELSNVININTGGIKFAAEAYEQKGTDENYYPKLIVRSKALVSKLPDLFEISGEILGNTKFDDPKRLREIVREVKSRYEMVILNRGHIMAAGRVTSYFSPVDKYRELIRGIEFYQFLAELESDFDSKVDSIISTLQEIYEDIFNINNLLISVTGEEKDYIKFAEAIHLFKNKLSSEKAKRISEYKFTDMPENEGLMTPGSVQYVAKGNNFSKLGYEYKGSMRVLSSLSTLDYLWNKVRVQGGAYGCFADFRRNGNVVFSSYRDPNLKETLDAYSKMVDYLDKFNVNNREMTKYIIGTISDLDHPLTPQDKGEKASVYYIKGITQEDVQRERDEVLSTNQSEIRKYADLVQKVMKGNYYCVIGNEAKIKDNKDMFESIVSVLK
jgi:presequence protease